MEHAVDSAQLLRLSNFLSQQIGLHFPQERWPDLLRGIGAAAREFNFDETASCVRWLLSSPLSKSQIEILASHLTVGETYFFREPQVFDALQTHVLPTLIQSRRQSGMHLRVWSAGCASGEEAYSLAILLQRMIPDFRQWNITILGTDINPHALRKAMSGTYSNWSFRNTPPWLRKEYFHAVSGELYEIIPAVKKMVTFSYLNLAEDSYPTLANNTNAMDIIFCRNVMMYFESLLATSVVHKLHHALVDGGWLIVSPAEMSQATFAQFAPANLDGAILHHKTDAPVTNNWRVVESTAVSGAARQPRTAVAAISPKTTRLAVQDTADPGQAEVRQPTFRQAHELYRLGRYVDAAAAAAGLLAQRRDDAESMTLMARILANQGELPAALLWCGQAIAADRLNPARYFLRAAILEEQQQLEEAMLSYKRALYLNQDFVLAHFALGNLCRRQNRLREAAKHFENALLLLDRHEQDEMLPESDGMTAGRLQEIIRRSMKLRDDAA